MQPQHSEKRMSPNCRNYFLYKTATKSCSFNFSILIQWRSRISHHKILTVSATLAALQSLPFLNIQPCWNFPLLVLRGQELVMEHSPMYLTARWAEMEPLRGQDLNWGHGWGLLRRRDSAAELRSRGCSRSGGHKMFIALIY